jgi:alanyl-tRNA synthetase
LNKPTNRLYYYDSYLAAFRAEVLYAGDGVASSRIVLDRTAFYPASGGQPHDTGTINGIPVVEVIDEEDVVVHVLASPLAATHVDGAVDWARRWDHMQQHTGQHLLSAVLVELFGFETVSFHMGAASSTIDLATPSLTPAQIEAAEARANALIQENRPVHVAFEDAATAAGLRKPSQRTGAIRIVTIDSLDRSACGGTHVRSTGEIGAILLRSLDKIRGNVRLEFVCGNRAVQAARADYNVLDRAARAFSARFEEVPALIAANLERLKETDKTLRRLEGELAAYRGRALYAETAPDARGLRIVEKSIAQGPFGDDVRSEANAFVGGGKAIFIALAEAPASILLAASADANVHCGNVIKRVLAEFAGRGGGAANLAQGSFTGDTQAFRARLRELLAAAV